MSADKLTVLGTASHLPTTKRAHNGYVVDLAGYRFLFDPGEGTQRQLTKAGTSVASLNGLLISHFHGDHCLGLPGVIQRRSVDNQQNGVNVQLPIVFPAEGTEFFEKLRFATIYKDAANLEPKPTNDGDSLNISEIKVEALRLNHRCPTLGYRLTAPDTFNFDVNKLDAAGITGQDRGRLKADGKLVTETAEFDLQDFGSVRSGKVVAFIMDTAPCDNAIKLAERADLVICESTYAESEIALAEQYLHLTAKQAASIAKQAKAGKLVLSHYSARYEDEQLLAEEAKEVFDNTSAAKDLDTFEY